ncbi:hypothetical protein Tco_0670790 [Tanacetum coccineum]
MSNVILLRLMKIPSLVNDVEYVEASPPNSEPVSSKVMEMDYKASHDNDHFKEKDCPDCEDSQFCHHQEFSTSSAFILGIRFS